MVGRMAYVWGWPLVNSHNRRAAFALAPSPGLNGGVLPMAPVGQNAMLTDYVKPEQSKPRRIISNGVKFSKVQDD